MAQYKHSRLANFKFFGSDFHNRSFVGTLVTFIVALLAVIIYAGIISVSGSFMTVTAPTIDHEKSTLTLSDTMALNDPFISQISEGWTFIPNITPDMVKTELDDAIKSGTEEWPSSVLIKDRPYATSVKISNSWYGWDDYANTADWHNSPLPIQNQEFIVETHECYCAAYVAHLECPKDIDSLSLVFRKFNGNTWIFCNGKYLTQIGSSAPVINLKALIDYCTLFPENGKIDLVIVFACSSKITNPGLLSEPVLETRTANDVRILISSAHISIVIVLFITALAGSCNILFNSTRNHTLILAFFGCFMSILFYYLDDCRFISIDSHSRSILRFFLLLLSSSALFLINSQFFRNSKAQSKYPLLKNAHYIVFAAALILFTVYIVCDIAFGFLFPEFTAILFALLIAAISIVFNLFFYNKEIQIRLLWSLLINLMLLMVYLAIHMGGTFVYTVPTYSNIFVFFTFIGELTLVATFLKQQRELKRNAAILKRQVREKTVFISEINRDLVLTNKKLVEGEAARKNVLSNVSHDLRTPITAIRGYAELMLNAQDSFTLEQRNTYLNNIIRRSEQMERIVADIMELTRMESSDADFRYTSISIAEMLDEIVVMYSMDLEDTEKHLSLNLPSKDPLIVKADPAKISRVFENLISNAINYTNPQAEITVRAWKEGEHLSVENQKVHIEVSDNGIGIPEQDIPRIFDRFYRAHNSGVNIKGTGLGLSIVKLICDKHDATINVRSKLGEGTTFEIIMPATY